MKKTIHNKIIILGSGPAGCSAAIYSARANLNPIVISGPQTGGQLITTTDVDNWVGAVDGIQGPDLMQNMQNHAKKFDTRFIEDTIIEADLFKRPFVLQGQENNYSADAIIIATGASAKYLGIESEKKFNGRGVSACATCDGFFFKNQNVAVIGGGNTAVEEALYLSNICASVTLVHRREEFRAEKILQDKLKKKQKEGKIILKTPFAVDEILGNEMGVNGLRLIEIASNKKIDIKIDGVFIAIGHSPNSSIFKNQISMTNNYIDTKTFSKNFTTQTSIKGVFAAGDVADFLYRQAITSAGTGCMAALDAEKFLDGVSE
jgi:thioredoxin reductase (NADPH)